MDYKSDLEKKAWWNYVESDIRELLLETSVLLKESAEWIQKFHDYSFIVFPAAKAYEGFLKKVFYDMRFITSDDYFGKRFRIGKSLNPNLDKAYRDGQYVYDEIVDYCGGTKLADKLWDTWKECRNILFHWFPNEKNAISYAEAVESYAKILSAMDEVFLGCKIGNKGNDKNE